MPLGSKIGLSPGDIVVDGEPVRPSKKGHSLPHFRPMSIVTKRLNGSRCSCKVAGLGPGHIVLDGDPDPPPTKGNSLHQFLAHVCCGQTAGWTKMPFDMEVGIGRGDFVLDGDPAPPKRGTAQLCVSWGPSSPPKRGTAP